MDVGQFRQAGTDRIMRIGYQFELRLAEVGGDVRVRQWRAEPCRMGCFGEAAIRSHAQAFFFNTAVEAAEHLGRKCA